MKSATHALLFTLVISLIPALASAKKKDNTPPVGDYTCRMDAGYKMRPCKVIDTNGIRELVIEGERRLIAIRAELLPTTKGGVYLSGKMTAARPFPCARCNEQCAANPESCSCTEVSIDDQANCKAQPIVSVLKRRGKTWSGTYPVKIYYGPGKDGKEWLQVEEYKVTIKAK
jgi:hypothetical protein